MSSHTLISGLVASPLPASSRSRRPLLLMAAALTVLAVGYCVVSQNATVSLASFTRLHWSYDEVDAWEGADCQHGSTQMPVDIKPEEALTSEQEPLKWAITDGVATPNIFYNGHAVQVQDFNTVATVKYGGKDYKLLQFHFHTPSENRINAFHHLLNCGFLGKAFAAEVHMVFGVLIEVVSPSAPEYLHSPMRPVFSSFSHLKGENKIPLAGFKVGDLLRAVQSSGLSSKYFFLPGSLTTPPCTQGVSWIVSAGHLSISNDDLAALQLIEGENSRTLQPLLKREVHKNFE